MEIDIRKHPEVRAQVWAGLVALKVQARQIWGEGFKQHLDQIALRLMVGVGDIARFERDNPHVPVSAELKKELGNLIFSTIRWIDDLGLDPIECIELAIEAQEKFAKSGRPR